MAVPPERATADSLTSRIEQLLAKAQSVKSAFSIEPPLPVSEFLGSYGIVSNAGEPVHQALIETAARSILQNILVSQRLYDGRGLTNVGQVATSIEEPSFVRVWNLLDIISICGDQRESKSGGKTFALANKDTEQCDISLAWRLIEELMDSQTIDGCRRIFDYLDSRRDRLVKVGEHITG